MSDQHGQAAATEKATDATPKAKRPYTKPSFREERVFETTALFCSKTGTQSSCTLNPPLKS